MFSCKDDDAGGGEMIPDCKDLTNIPFLTSPKVIVLPEGYQPIDDQQPLDNLMTNEGVLLGRHLFFDPILSADSTMSCSTCHRLDGNFTDNKAVSPGIDGVNSRRSSMSIVDLVYAENLKPDANNGLFWDGRVSTLEKQALLPVEDPTELHDTWDNVEGLTFFTDETALGIDDLGRYRVTGADRDIGHFRVPSLRNIEFSAPYMHDGRFNTLEEVMDHYICGIEQSPTLDPLMQNHCDPNNQMQFIDEQGKQDIIAFMLMLSDTTFFDNPDYQSPF